MFTDEVKIIIKAGKGGDGAVSFRREKYVAYGGPDGGDGGKGGNVLFVGEPGLRTLADFRFKRRFEAQDGEKGGNNKKYGRDGADITVRVPLGTIIYNEDDQVVADIQSQTPVVILEGGRGGRGNVHFATPSRQTPNFAKPGGAAHPFEVTLRLKTLADAGLIGLPNAGKSSLLAAATRANPKIADYPFTTLHPNLGLADVGGYTFCLADIPGLIEGAAGGAGLGHDFLRHIERTRVLVHVVDIGSEEPLRDFETVQNELAQYSEVLTQKPLIVAANKMDLDNAEENLKLLKKQLAHLEIFPMIAILNEGVRPLLECLAEMLVKLPEIPPETPQAVLAVKPEGQPYTITRDPDGTAVAEGPMMRRLCATVNFEDYDSLRYFHKVLKDYGVIDALRTFGVAEGDGVRVEGMEFDFVE